MSMEKVIELVSLNEEIVRILLLSFTSFFLATLVTPIYTTLAFRYEWWKKLRQVAITGETAQVLNRLHEEKHRRHIPTMAGLVFLFAVCVVTLLFNWTREQTWLPLAATVGAGFIGLIDDIVNIRGVGRGVAGLSSRLKFALIFFVAILGALYFYYKLGYDSVYVPFVGDFTVGILLIPIFILVVVATANAVNITDGLDGLAGGLATSAFLAYGFIALLQGHFGIAGFCLTIVGALLSYVWFNIFPARFFMGDVGSFALGTALGVVAMLTNTLFLLPVIGLLFVVEAGSSLVQILSKKFTGKKIFRSAPIHHHFEALGWPETKVTMRFWILGQVAGVAGLIIALLGGHI